MRFRSKKIKEMPEFKRAVECLEEMKEIHQNGNGAKDHSGDTTVILYSSILRKLQA